MLGIIPSELLLSKTDSSVVSVKPGRLATLTDSHTLKKTKLKVQQKKKNSLKTWCAVFCWSRRFQTINMKRMCNNESSFAVTPPTDGGGLNNGKLRFSNKKLCSLAQTMIVAFYPNDWVPGAAVRVSESAEQQSNTLSPLIISCRLLTEERREKIKTLDV